MPCKVKLSDEYKKKKARMKNLPKIGKLALYGLRKKDAAEVIKLFHDGIKDKKLGLRKLSKVTINMKELMEYQHPKTPLDGKGDEDKKNSYMNMLRMRKMKNGWKVSPSLGKHHKANMKLRDMLKKHETGYIIKVTPKMRAYLHSVGIHLKQSTKIMRVPPRPAFLLAKNKFLANFRAKQEDKLIKKKITEYINKGKDDWFNEMAKIFYGKYKDLVE